MMFLVSWNLTARLLQLVVGDDGFVGLHSGRRFSLR